VLLLVTPLKARGKGRGIFNQIIYQGSRESGGRRRRLYEYM
jgi:hypothetical protein